MAATDKFGGVIADYIKSNRIMIFSKSSCPYCVRVKGLFKTLGEAFFSLELDNTEDGDKLQQAMAKKAGRSTVPQVFINGELVGGCDDTLAAHENGNLEKMLIKM